MLQFQIVLNTLKISNESTAVFSISKKDVYYNQPSLNESVPKISLYNVNVGILSVVFQAPLSECLDPNGDPFTVNSFTIFAEANLGFNSDGASSITVTDSYATLPAPATVSGQFYWCENADGTFPVGLYYSDGTTWQFQTSENITVVANYSALPAPATVSGQFYWCENAQGTYPVGLYYSNGTTWQFSIADNITVVANYSALPDPTTVSGQFFWAEASQGTSWLPAGLGGTYYSAGMYYSNGVSWSFIDVPYQASQAEVNAGINTNKFVTPSTLKNQNYLAPLASPTFTGAPSAPTQSPNDNSTKIATTAYADAKVADAIANGVTTVAPSQNAVFDALAFKQNNIKTFETTQGIYFFEEFMGNLGANVTVTAGGVTNTVGNGQGATRTTLTITNKTNQQGVVESLTSANSTGTAGWYYGGGVFKGSGAITIETYVNFTTLSTLAERYISLFGVYTGSNFNNPLNVIAISYDEGGQFLFANPSPNFKCVTRGGATNTTSITSVTVNAGQWYKLRIEISNDGSVVTFFIDNALVATHNSNTPLNTTALPIGAMLQKMSGTTARAMQTDYFMYEEIFTNPR